MTTRYAVYYAPDADHALNRRAEEWLGYSAWSFADNPQLEPPGFAPAAFEKLTAAPRKYGFHGTLKPPFRLADGKSETDLVDAVARESSVLSAIALSGLTPRFIGHFLALVPDEPSAELSDLAATVVERFEPFRAPLNASETERRLRAPLTIRQIDHLERWGYPYVFEEFRFHLTLTGPVPDDQRDLVMDAAQNHFAGSLEKPFSIDRLVIFKQPEPGRSFFVLRSFALEQPDGFQQPIAVAKR